MSLRTLLAPMGPSSPHVRAELLEQLQQAMRVVGVVTIILHLSNLLSLWLADLSDYTVMSDGMRSVADATSFSSVILGATVFALARQVESPRQGRVVLFLFALLATALVVRFELLTGSEAPVSEAFITYLLLIAVAPFRPREALGLGLLLVAVFVAVTVGYPAPEISGATRVSRIVAGVVPLFVLSATGAVLSGVLYEYRSRAARAQAEREVLRHKLEEIAEVAEVSPTPTMRFAPTGELLWSNPAADQYSTKVGAPQRSIVDYLPPTFSTGGASDASHTQMVTSYEAHGRFFNVNYKPVPGAKELIVTLTDVTEQTRARRKAERFAEELERAQIKLVQSEKMASLGNLVAGVAHEVNTPLGAIKSNNHMLAKAHAKLEALPADAPPDKRDKILSAMAQGLTVNDTAIGRIDAIVDSLRRFARLDQSERGRVSLRAEIENTLTLVRHKLEGRITLKTHFDEVPELACFPNQLNQVFLNLVVNAIQSIEGEGDVEVSLTGEGEDLVVRVRDTGCGIPQAHLQKIFDPGFTTKGVGVGTGLGLSIVHRIVEDHRGRIEVDSEVGAGSTFTLYLPLDATAPP